MFIDIHVHTNARPAPLRAGGRMTYATPEYLLRKYSTASIEAAVVLPTIGPECAHQIQSNEEVLQIAATFPGRFIPFCNIHPRMASNSPAADLAALVGYYKAQGCKGVGEVSANLPFDDPMVFNLFSACSDHSMPVTFHIADRIGGYYGLYDDPGLPRLEQALKTFPEVTFLGHSQAFWAEIGPLAPDQNRQSYPSAPINTPGRVVELMQAYPNLHGDLSAGSGFNALKRDHHFALSFIDEFQDRLYFGTDVCHPDTDMPLAAFLSDLREQGEITVTAFRKVARENAIRLLGLNRKQI